VRFRLLLVAAAAALLVGCGGNGKSSETPATDRAAQAPAEVVGGGKATVVEGRLGDATTATERGEEKLSPGGEVDPNAAAPTEGQQEGVGAGATCTQVDVLPSAHNDATVSAAILCLLNGERRDRGLVPLRVNRRLGRAASAQADDMVRRSYFAHRSPEGTMPSDRIRATGYLRSDRSWTVGENLAWGTAELSSARGLVNAWMNSPGHRANILKPVYREIGIGVSLGTPSSSTAPGATVATTFGVIR
jgi:uncharacterized protein YkwD